MLEFSNDEDGYLQWIKSNPCGHVVNLDKAGKDPDYPLVHRASCHHLSRHANYTTNVYMKVCSLDFNELEQWCRDKFRRELKRCETCMRKSE